jgi:hypothetical protein
MTCLRYTEKTVCSTKFCSPRTYTPNQYVILCSSISFSFISLFSTFPCHLPWELAAAPKHTTPLAAHLRGSRRPQPWPCTARPISGHAPAHAVPALSSRPSPIPGRLPSVPPLVPPALELAHGRPHAAHAMPARCFN